MCAKPTDYENAVESLEPATAAEVADHLGISKGHTQKVLKELAEERPDVGVTREPDGNSYLYTTTDADGTPDVSTAPDATNDRLMPVVRGYDFSARSEVSPHEYHATNGELRRLLARTNGRHRSTEPVRALVDGHSGTGKTTLSLNIAGAADAAFFELNCTDDMSDADMFGSPSLAGDSTLWVDGVVTKALMASAPVERQVAEGWVESEEQAHDGPAVLLVDELNRAPPKAKNALFSALDDRCRVALDGPRGGEVIQGDPLDLIVISTINEGREYHGTHRLDHAEANRFTNRYTSEYLATYDLDTGEYDGVDREAELLVDRRDMPAEAARSMSEVAAEIRAKANDATNTNVDVGVSTRQVLAWAGTVIDYEHAGIDDVFVAAANDTILGEYDADGYDEALGVVEDALKDVPFDPDEFEAAMADEVVVCDACEWETHKQQAEDMGVLALGECPNCGDDRSITVERR